MLLSCWCVCLSVCVSVRRIILNVMNGFALIFLPEVSHGQGTMLNFGEDPDNAAEVCSL